MGTLIANPGAVDSLNSNFTTVDRLAWISTGSSGTFNHPLSDYKFVIIAMTTSANDKYWFDSRMVPVSIALSTKIQLYAQNATDTQVYYRVVVTCTDTGFSLSNNNITCIGVYGIK